MRSLSLALATWAFALATASLDPIEVYGNKFFHKDGSQYFLKGNCNAVRKVVFLAPAANNLQASPISSLRTTRSATRSSASGMLV